jgi:hypothetical protein
LHGIGRGSRPGFFVFDEGRGSVRPGVAGAEFPAKQERPDLFFKPRAAL